MIGDGLRRGQSSATIGVKSETSQPRDNRVDNGVADGDEAIASEAGRDLLDPPPPEFLPVLHEVPRWRHRGSIRNLRRRF